MVSDGSKPTFRQATDFANRLPPEAIINISHSGGEGHGTNAVTVWYSRKQTADEWNEQQGDS